MAQLIIIPLQTAINDYIVRLMDRTDAIMMNFIWERGWDGRGNVLWDDMLGVASALAAVFSLFLVAKIAFKSMVLEDRLDVMKLWKPFAIMLVLANWYAITWSIYSITVPFEDFFRGAFESQNTAIISLQNQRMAAAKKVNNRLLEQAALARAGDEVEVEALSRDEYNDDDDRQVEQTEEDNDILISNYGELYYDMRGEQTDANGNPLPKFDATEEVLSVKIQNLVERFILWTAEAFWCCMVMILFLVRAFFMAVLVTFGPIYMAASILPAWEDAWKQWLERYIWVNLLGAMAFLALTFALIIVQFGVKMDVGTYNEIATQDAAWYDFLAHAMKSFICSIGLYLTSLFVGIGLLSVAFELASMVFPTQGIQAAGNFFEGIYMTAKNESLNAAKKVVTAAVTAGNAAAGAAMAQYIHRQEDDAVEDLDLGANMGPEGRMADGRSTGEYQGRSNSYDDHRNSSVDGQMQDSTAAAHRWADRKWQQLLSGRLSRQDRQRWHTRNLAAAGEDLDEFLKAQAEGRGKEFVENMQQRFNDNRILLEIYRTGHAGLHLFGGDEKLRDSFLKRYGLAGAIRIAEKNSDKADKMKPGHNRRKKAVRDARRDVADSVNRMVTEKVKDILTARGIPVTGVMSPQLIDLDGLPTDEAAQNSSAHDGTDGDDKRSSRTSSRRWTDSQADDDVQGTYRLQPTDDGYDNVQQQMQRPWFRKMTGNRRNRQLLLLTLQAYERALQRGKGDQFLKELKSFGLAGYSFDEHSEKRTNLFSHANVADSEYRHIWDELRDTETLRKVNEALDAIERAQDSSSQEEEEHASDTADDDNDNNN